MIFLTQYYFIIWLTHRTTSGSHVLSGSSLFSAIYFVSDGPEWQISVHCAVLRKINETHISEKQKSGAPQMRAMGQILSSSDNVKYMWIVEHKMNLHGGETKECGKSVWRSLIRLESGKGDHRHHSSCKGFLSVASSHASWDGTSMDIYDMQSLLTSELLISGTTTHYSKLLWTPLNWDNVHDSIAFPISIGFKFSQLLFLRNIH